MEKNEVTTVYDVIDLVNGEVENTKTAVIRDRDNTTTWLDVDDDPEAKRALEVAKVVATLGFLVLDKWDKMKHHFSKEIQEQIETFIDEVNKDLPMACEVAYKD